MAKPIKVEILGDATGFSKAMDTVGTRLGGMSKMVGAAGLAIGAGVVGGVAVAVKGLADLGDRFDGISDQIRVTTGKTGEALAGLESSFKNVGKTVAVPLEQVGTAIGDINRRLELTGKPLETLSAQFLNLSKITGTDLAMNIDTITRVFGDWGVKTEDMTGVLDQLYRTTQASGITLDDLSQTLVQFGAPLRSLGFSLQESEALLALWNKTGVNTELVMSGLKIAAGKFGKEGKVAADEIKKVIDQVKKLTDAGKSGEAISLAIDVFGKKSGTDFVDMIAGGKFEIQGLLDTIANGKDTIDQSAKDTADWAEQWQLIKNKVMIGLEPIASKVFAGIGAAIGFVAPKLTEFITGGVNSFKEAWERADGAVTKGGFNGVMERLAGIIKLSVVPWLRETANQWLPKLKKAAEAVGAYFRDTLMPAFVKLAKAVLPVAIDMVKKALTILTEGLKWLWGHKEALIGFGVILAAMFGAWAVGAAAAAISTLAAAAPIIALGVAIGALAVLFKKAYEENEGFREKVDALTGWVKDKLWPALKDLGGWIRDTLIPIIVDVAEFIADWSLKIANFAMDAASYTDDIYNGISSFVTKLADIGTQIFDAIVWPYKKAYDEIYDILVVLGLVDGPKKAASTIFKGGLGGRTFGPGGGGGATFGSGGGGGATFGSGGGGGADFGGGRATGQSYVGRGPTGAPTNRKPTRSGFAWGGDVLADGMYRVGERGPETRWLNRGDRIAPAHVGGGRGDTFHIYAPNATPAQVASEIAWRRRMGDGR